MQLTEEKARKWLLPAVVGLAVLLVLSLLTLRWAEAKKVQGASSTAKQFFQLLADGQYSQAENLTTGLEKYQVRKNANLFSPVDETDMVSFDYQPVAVSRNYVQFKARVISQSREHFDVQWYNVTTILDKGFWLVLNVQYTQPWHNGTVDSRGLENIDQKDIASVFDHYRWDVEQGNYQDSLQYLSGQAKLSQEQSSSILKLGNGKTGVYQPGQVKLDVLWSDGSLVIGTVSYEFGGRPVQVIATFYKLPDGWKIVNVIQS